MLLFAMVLQSISHAAQVLEGQLVVCLRVQPSCGYWIDVLEGWQWEWILVDKLENFCHAFSCYSLDSTTTLDVDMLHTLLVPLPVLVKSVISISMIITSSHHVVDFKVSSPKHVIFQPIC